MEKQNLISYCGLYCGACFKYKKGKCPGCALNTKATWCKIRTCCMEKAIDSCAQCDEFVDVKQCKKYNNPVSKLFEFVFRTDRTKGIELLQAKGADVFVDFMSEKGWVSIKKKYKGELG